LRFPSFEYISEYIKENEEFEVLSPFIDEIVNVHGSNTFFDYNSAIREKIYSHDTIDNVNRKFYKSINELDYIYSEDQLMFHLGKVVNFYDEYYSNESNSVYFSIEERDIFNELLIKRMEE
jgi:hypothetical protein